MSVNRLGIASRSPGSYGRTDGRTDEESLSPTRDISPLVTRARAYDDFADDLLLFVDVLEVAQQRLDRKRRGDRADINWQKRALIFMRDGYHCRWCGDGVEQLQVDHITPWSAGGSDRSDNLRTLCRRCNAQRSNRITDEHTRVLPVTTCCEQCYIDHYGGDMPDTRIPAFCGHCRMASWVTDWNDVL